MKHITSFALALILALSAVACGGGEAEPEGTTAGSTTAETTAVVTAVITDVTAHDTAPETTVMTNVETKADDIDSLIEGYTVHEVTTERIMYTVNTNDPDKAYDAQKHSYIVPYAKYEERWQNGEQFSEKIAVRFTDIGGLTVFAHMRTEDGCFFSEIDRIAYSDYVIECSTLLTYSERWFDVLKSDNAVVIRSEYDTDCYLLSTAGYTAVPSIREDGGIKSKLQFYIHDDELRYTYTNVLFSDVVSLGGDVRADYSSEDDLYTESGKVVLHNGIPRMTMLDKETVAEWYQSDDFPYANIRDEYGFSTLRDMAKRFSGTEGYQEFLKIYEELERGTNDN